MSNAAALESNVWKAYRNDTRYLRRLGLHRTRIENGVESGTPDTNEALLGREWWYEMKSSKRSVSSEDSVKIKWRPGQQEWLRRRCKAGCRAYLLLQVGKGAGRARYLIEGDHAPYLERCNEAALAELSLVSPRASSQEILAAASGLDLEDMARGTKKIDT